LVLSPKFKGQTNSTEHFYGIQYKVQDIPQQKLDVTKHPAFLLTREGMEECWHQQPASTARKKYIHS
jgi:hypothetical protein